MASTPPDGGPTAQSDEARALRFLALKAAIFILVPLAAAALAIYLKFGSFAP